jgi:hypothetical protein
MGGLWLEVCREGTAGASGAAVGARGGRRLRGRCCSRTGVATWHMRACESCHNSDASSLPRYIMYWQNRGGKTIDQILPHTEVGNRASAPILSACISPVQAQNNHQHSFSHNWLPQRQMRGVHSSGMQDTQDHHSRTGTPRPSNWRHNVLGRRWGGTFHSLMWSQHLLGPRKPKRSAGRRWRRIREWHVPSHLRLSKSC